MDMTYEKVSKANIGVDLSFAKALDVTVEFLRRNVPICLSHQGIFLA